MNMNVQIGHLAGILQNHCGSLVAKGMCNPRQSRGIS